MEAALASEVKAHAFFVAALPALKDIEVRALFEELRDEEIEHQHLVKIELAKLPPDKGLSDEDFVDEPTAQ
jgi:rubrerythrin